MWFLFRLLYEAVTLGRAFIKRGNWIPFRPNTSEKWFIEIIILCERLFRTFLFNQNNRPAFHEIYRKVSSILNQSHCAVVKLYSNNWILIFMCFPYVSMRCDSLSARMQWTCQSNCYAHQWLEHENQSIMQGK